MLEYIQENPKNIILEEVNINDFPKGLSSINESHMDLVEISKPVILAEISPEKYNIIDGHHRIEKARRLGITKILAYRFKAEQHLRFLTNKRAYLAYVEYWNSKLEEFIETLKFNQR
ncbi:MAG: ParB N-terminal domain-containing protein [Candidatus Marinimicrobia bacterium]|nr:ParB N-terminal domain-containing protein [Candidatus Neomarinimicrobiota bacterium]